MDRDDSWKAGLDHYLTSGGDYGEYDSWCEQVIESFDDDFYNENEDWINDFNTDFDTWLNKLYGDHKTPMEAAVKIQRLRTLYHK